MSIKTKQAIIESLMKIENQEFDEDTVRTLLIVSREYLNFDGLIKELAHFIAHPARDQGIFHKKVNARYTKLKLIEEQLSKSKPKITTEDELSDFMLGAMSIEKIDSKLFRILYSDGLDDLPESHLLEYTGFTKAEARKFIQNHYTKKDNLFYLNTLRTRSLISRMEQLPDHQKDEEMQKSILDAKELIMKIESKMDSLQKVIRGAIHFSSVFDANELGTDFKLNFDKIFTKFEIDLKYTKVITENLQGILICLMSLIHDSTFTFYDKKTARIYLCGYMESNVQIKKEFISENEKLYELGFLSLYMEGSSGSSPLFVSNIKLKDYIKREEFINADKIGVMNEIPWIAAKRVDAKLTLVKYS